MSAFSLICPSGTTTPRDFQELNVGSVHTTSGKVRMLCRAIDTIMCTAILPQSMRCVWKSCSIYWSL